LIENNNNDDDDDDDEDIDEEKVTVSISGFLPLFWTYLPHESQSKIFQKLFALFINILFIIISFENYFDVYMFLKNVEPVSTSFSCLKTSNTVNITE